VLIYVLLIFFSLKCYLLLNEKYYSIESSKI
jgi:hypothetical protein